MTWNTKKMIYSVLRKIQLILFFTAFSSITSSGIPLECNYIDDYSSPHSAYKGPSPSDGRLDTYTLWPHAETTNSEAYEVYALLDKELTTIEFKIFPTQLAIDELIIESHLITFESDPYYNYGGCKDVKDATQEKRDGCIKGMESYLQDFNTKFVSSIKGPFKSEEYFYKGGSGKETC